MSWDVREGDCLEVMRGMPDASVDAIVTDPPSGISFMGREWDHDKGGRRQWIAWLTEVMREALRVIRPGGHAFVWALPRTSHWTATALEDAGWEIRDVCTHLFASGFPKSHDVSKAIDKMAGVEREVIGRARGAGNGVSYSALDRGHVKPASPWASEYDATTPATDAAKQWDGYGTALKPSSEHWILCRRPLSEPTVAANVLKHSTGALNIAASRIGSDRLSAHGYPGRSKFGVGGKDAYTGNDADPVYTENVGRWPANAVFSHTDACVPVGVRRVRGIIGGSRGKSSHIYGGGNGLTDAQPEIRGMTYADADGTEQVLAFRCVEGCPVRILDEQAGERKSGTGAWRTHTSDSTFVGIRPPGREEISYNDGVNASRFFFISKASRSERERGLEHRTKATTRVVNNQNFRECVDCGRHYPNSAAACVCGGELRTAEVANPPRANTHPCVKSLDLMDHLIKLVCPPNGTVLDPFCGSGSTGCSAVRLGFNFIGIEAEPEYVSIARDRIAFWSDPVKVARYEQEQAAERARAMAEAAVEDAGYVMASLFGDDV